VFPEDPSEDSNLIAKALAFSRQRPSNEINALRIGSPTWIETAVDGIGLSAQDVLPARYSHISVAVARAAPPLGVFWLWARPRYRVATLVAVGAAGATWANVVRRVAVFRATGVVPSGSGIDADAAGAGGFCRFCRCHLGRIPQNAGAD